MKAPIVLKTAILSVLSCLTLTSTAQSFDAIRLDNIPQSMRSDYIREGYKYRQSKWTAIPDSVFQEFRRTGNRANFQRLSFGTRRQMAHLVMAEIMEGKGVLIKPIIQGLHHFINETWWGISAHYPTSLPEADNQVVDLFNAETASMLAWTILMLRKELDHAEPGITQRISNEINRRILTPCLTTDYSWKHRADNWNPWICSNWLTCVLICEKDQQRRQDAISQIMQCLKVFYDNYSEDGGCDEGVLYWDRSPASYCESMFLLEKATGRKMAMLDDAKLRRMASYIYKMNIGKDRLVTFGDCSPTNLPNINILYPIGWRLEDRLMRGYAARIAQQYDYARHPSDLFNRSGNFPTLGRELMFLSLYDKFKQEKPAEPLALDNWLPQLQIVTARSVEGSTSGLYLAAKGGCNEDNHNHNDVGNFVVYGEAEPLVIDLGTENYTAKTFSNKRYELMSCRSAYHNVPLINGTEQRNGRQYQARDVAYTSTDKYVRFSLDIAGAYPEEAHVKTWKRNITMLRGKSITVEEDYELSRRTGDTEIMLLTCEKPSYGPAGTILFQSKGRQYQLTFPSNKINPFIEKIEITDKYLYDLWQGNVWRIHLRLKSRRLRGNVNYVISPR